MNFVDTYYGYIQKKFKKWNIGLAKKKADKMGWLAHVITIYTTFFVFVYKYKDVNLECNFRPHDVALQGWQLE